MGASAMGFPQRQKAARRSGINIPWCQPGAGQRKFIASHESQVEVDASKSG